MLNRKETKVVVDSLQCAYSYTLQIQRHTTYIEIKQIYQLIWQEADQLAIYKHERGVELGSITKQLQLSGQSGT